MQFTGVALSDDDVRGILRDDIADDLISQLTDEAFSTTPYHDVTIRFSSSGAGRRTSQITYHYSSDDFDLIVR